MFGASNFHFRQQVPGSFGLRQGRSALPCVGFTEVLAGMPAAVRSPSRLPGATTARPLQRVARSETHLAPARFGTTERLLQGFPKSRPSIDITTGVRSRVCSGCPAHPLRSVAASDRRVPPSWSLTTSTVFSTDGSWACCIPQPIMGFIGFHPCVVAARARFSPESPPMPYPPELSPPVQPHRHSCRPLPSCRFGLRSWCYQGPPTSRPCSERASVVVNLRCRSSTPVALLGFPVSEATRSSSLLTYANRSRRPLGPRSPLGGRRQSGPGIHRRAAFEDGPRAALVRPREVEERTGEPDGEGLPACQDRRAEARRPELQAHGDHDLHAIAGRTPHTPDVTSTLVPGDEDHHALSARRPEQATVCVKAKAGGAELRGPTERRSLAGRPTSVRGPLASGRSSVCDAGCAPARRLRLRTHHKPGRAPPGLPDETRPNPGLRGRHVAVTPLLLVRRRVSSDGPHRGRLRHIRSPSRERHRAALSDRPAGSVARMRPHRPQPTPAALPRWPTHAAPCVGSVAVTPRCPRTVGTAPVSSSFRSISLRVRIARMVEHPTEATASVQRRPSLRGDVRVHRTEARRRVTRRRPMDRRHDHRRAVTDARG